MERQVGVPLLLGVVSTVVVIVGTVVGVATTGYLLQSFTVFFVIPAGAFIAGAGCASGIFLGLLWLNRKPEKIHYRLAGVLGVVGFVGTYLALYLTTYVTPDYSINHSFKGVPISAALSFLQYMQLDISSRASTFFVSVGHTHVPVGGTEGVQIEPLNWISFAVEPVGYLLGALMLAPQILGSKLYCESCSLYMKTKVLFRANPEDASEKAGLLDGAVASSGYALKTLAEQESKAYKSNGGPWAEFAMEYCPRCFDGFVHVKAMRPTRSSYEEVMSARHSVRLDRAVAHDFLVKVISPTN